jgi:Tfp pilus assembly protein PilF
MLDRLIEPTMAELIDVVTKRARALDVALENEVKAGSIKDTERSAKAARKMLEQALKELEGGDLDNATNHLKKAIRHLRRITEEREELARDAGKLDTLVKQLEALNALERLARG